MMEDSLPKSSVHGLLKEIFTQYCQGYTKEIDISELRLKLAELYSNLSLFDINMPGDATEVLIEILKCLHNDYQSLKNSKNCQKNCISHSLFNISVQEFLICRCSGEKKVDWDPETFAHHFYVSQLFIPPKLTPEKISKVKVEDLNYYRNESSVLETSDKMLQILNGESFCTLEYCAGGNDFCAFRMSEKTSQLMLNPKVYISHVIWDHSHPSRLKLLQFLAAIPLKLDLSLIFECREELVYGLTSFLAFGMGHYMAFLYKEGKWYCLDDVKSFCVGSWLDITLHLLKQRFYPVSLFYLFEDVLDHEIVDVNEFIKLEYFLVESEENKGTANDCITIEDWTCNCGFRNTQNSSFCDHCKRNKPGVQGWVCTFCTYFNQSYSLNCEACLNQRDSLPKFQEKTQGINKRNISFNASQRTRHSAPSKCKLCDSELKEKFRTCVKCLIKSSKSSCGICGSSLKAEYCKNCIFLLSYCKDCEDFHIQGICKVN